MAPAKKKTAKKVASGKSKSSSVAKKKTTSKKSSSKKKISAFDKLQEDTRKVAELLEKETQDIVAAQKKPAISKEPKLKPKPKPKYRPVSKKESVTRKTKPSSMPKKDSSLNNKKPVMSSKKAATSELVKRDTQKAAELLQKEMEKAQMAAAASAVAEEKEEGIKNIYEEKEDAPAKPTKKDFMNKNSQPESRMLEEEVHYYQKQFKKIRKEMAKVVVGQTEIIDALIEALLAKGHVLVEGVPGIAKTLIVRCMSIVTGCQFARIQFTPDLLPSDIVGVNTYEEGKGFYTLKGPIFANYVLADEINRAPPKVQSALLEAMQEKQVTIGRESFLLPKPFFVMATQNPVENLGTYPLPEAQVDRFLFKLLMTYPKPEEELEIMHKNMSLHRIEDFNLQPVLNPESISQAQIDVQKIYLDPKIEQYIVRIVDASRNPKKFNIKGGKYLEYGGSPRSTISLFIAAKAHALIKGRTYVIPHDVKEVAKRVLRHRVIMNYEGQAEGVSSDAVVAELLKKVPIIEPKLV